MCIPNPSLARLRNLQNKEIQRKAAQKEKKRLRVASEAAVAAGKLAAGSDDVDRLCNGLELEAVQKLATAVEGAAASIDDQVELLTVALCSLDGEYRRKREEAEASRKEKMAELVAKEQAEAEKKKERKPWTPEDEKAFDKALKQFPQGTLRRWEQIAAYLGDGRTAEEVLELNKSRQTKGASAPGEDFDRFLEARVKKGSVEIKDAVTTRAEARCGGEGGGGGVEQP